MGYCSSSEKKSKSKCNRKLRRRTNIIISNGDFDVIFPNKREMMDVWEMEKDGKFYYGQPETLQGWIDILGYGVLTK